MKKFPALIALTVSTALLSAPAYPSDGSLGLEKWLAEGALSLVVHDKRYSDRHERWDRHDRHRKKKRDGGVAVPEIDAAGAALALGLLAGLVAIGRELRRRRE